MQDYRRKVYRIISSVIATHGGFEREEKITWEHPLWSIFMGVEHEAIHLETSSVLFRETPSHLMQVPKVWPRLHPSAFKESSSNPTQQDAPSALFFCFCLFKKV